MSSNQNVQGQNGDRGPSYWDVDRAAEAIRQEFSCGLRFVVLPPCYIASTGQRSSWVVSVQMWRIGKAEIPEMGAQCAWGAGGACKTMPQALHRALLMLQSKLEEARRQAERQTRF